MTDEQRKKVEESIILMDSTRKKIKNYSDEAIELAYEVQGNIRYKADEYIEMLKSVIRLLADEKKLFEVSVETKCNCCPRNFEAYSWIFRKQSPGFNKKGIFLFISYDLEWIKIPEKHVTAIYINDGLVFDNRVCTSDNVVNCYPEINDNKELTENEENKNTEDN